MNFNKIIRRPYRLEASPEYRLLQAVAFGMFVFLFLWIFKPFQIRSVSLSLPLACLGFGAVTTGVMVVLNIFIPKVKADFFDPGTWTTGKEFVWTLANIFVIGLFNFLYFGFLIEERLSPGMLLWFQSVTLAVSVFPVGFLILWRESRASGKYKAESDRINKSINEHDANTDSQIITVRSLNDDEDLMLSFADLQYIAAADNYIEVHFTEGGSERKKLLRNTLTAVANELESHKGFFKCHRSYAVNLNRVESVSGNAQGYKLHLKGSDFCVPVSRRFNEEIKKRLGG